MLPRKPGSRSMQRDESFDFDSRAGIKNHIEDRLLKTRLSHLKREQQIRFNALTNETNKVRQLLRQMPPPLSLSRSMSSSLSGSPRHVDDDVAPTNGLPLSKRPKTAWSQTICSGNDKGELSRHPNLPVVNGWVSNKKNGGHSHHALDGRMMGESSPARPRCKHGWLDRVQTHLEDSTTLQNSRESFDPPLGERRRAKTCVPESRTFESGNSPSQRCRSYSMPLERNRYRSPGSLTMSRCLTKNVQQNTRHCRSFLVLKNVQISQHSAVERTWPVREEVSTQLLKDRRVSNIQGLMRQKVQNFLTKELPPSGVLWAQMSDSSDEEDNELQMGELRICSDT